MYKKTFTTHLLKNTKSLSVKRHFVKKTPDTKIHLQKALKANKNII